MDSAVNEKENSSVKSKTSANESHQFPSHWLGLLEERKSELAGSDSNTQNSTTHSSSAMDKRLEGSSAWLLAYRQNALARLAASGFPSAKSEDFKYFPFTELRQKYFSSERASQRSTTKEAAHRMVQIRELLPDSCCLVFVDGTLNTELSDSLPSGMRMFRGVKAVHEIERLQEETGMRESLNSLETGVGESFVSALGAAFSREFVFVTVEKNAVVDTPVTIVSLGADRSPGTDSSDSDSSDSASATGEHAEHSVGYLRSTEVLVHAAEHSRAQFVEILISEGSSATELALSKTHFSLASGSQVDYLKVQSEDPRHSYHLGQVHARLARDAHFEGVMLVSGAKQSRNEGYLYFEDQGAHGALNGLTVLGAEQRADNFTVLRHARENCTSHELFKSILCDSSIGSFTGTIIVDEGAQKTNAIQHNQSLLLSRAATSNSKPQLKIWADDVKCTHGATVGEMDDEALFYLRSRGIGLSDARTMLVRAFAGDVLKEIRPAALRTFADSILDRQLELRSGSMSFEQLVG